MLSFLNKFVAAFSQLNKEEKIRHADYLTLVQGTVETVLKNSADEYQEWMPLLAKFNREMLVVYPGLKSDNEYGVKRLAIESLAFYMKVLRCTMNN